MHARAREFVGAADGGAARGVAHRIKSHASAVMSLSVVTLWSSSSVQSSSTSLSRKDCSSADSFGVYVSTRCCRLGEPPKMSRSKPTVPAPRAIFSVSLIFGMALRARL